MSRRYLVAMAIAGAYLCGRLTAANMSVGELWQSAMGMIENVGTHTETAGGKNTVQSEETVVLWQEEQGEPENAKSQTMGSIVIQTACLNVRKTPNGEICGTVSLGEQMDYFDRDGNWIKIAFRDDYGYVYAPYTDIYSMEGILVAAHTAGQEPYTAHPSEEPQTPEEPEQPQTLEEPKQLQQFGTMTRKASERSAQELAALTREELYGLIAAEITVDCTDDYQKVIAINNFLCERITYDIDHYTTYDAIVNGVGRCQGYANAFKTLANLAGIPTDYVRGRVNGSSTTHAWNRVLIDGNYYCVDVTFNDSTDSDTYLLIPEAQFNVGREIIGYNTHSE